MDERELIGRQNMVMELIRLALGTNATTAQRPVDLAGAVEAALEAEKKIRSSLEPEK